MTESDAPGGTGYGPADAARWVSEPYKRPGRTAFQRDRARVQHSAALRRLAGKTQVVAPDTASTADFPRTRLTHSLECAQIGRDLGAALGCDGDLVEAACLAHDLGHPPFGHNGETELDAFAERCGGFEGNAQSFRLLTRLEPKRFAPDGSPAGLNLTRAVLDGVSKYPWPKGAPGSGPRERKYGVYAEDLPVFRWMREGAPEGVRCFEAQVMDWADDVAYAVHDVEDAVYAGHVVPGVLGARGERAGLLELAGGYAPEAEEAELGAALDRLLALPYWPGGPAFDAGAAWSARTQAALKDAASQLIGRFCGYAERATREAYGAGLPRYGADLVVPGEVRAECAVLKAVAARYVMQREEEERRRAEERAVLGELCGALWRLAPRGLGPLFAPAWEAAADDAARLRVVVDRVAGLTDAGARALRGRLAG